ncbi:MAG: serine hydrolase [Pseudoxanthomonas sp.]
MRLTALLGIALLLALPAQAQGPTPLPARLQDFDHYVDQVREQFDVPGIAVAIVKDGQVVLARGYGVKEIGKPERVGPDTLFAIASNTKAFTAASLQILADEGKLDMDDRVVERLPGFRMADPYITHEMRIRDLLAHRSGLSLGAGDLLYWPTTDYSNAEVVQHLAQVPIKGEFRAQYAYDNILFGVAQQVIERVSGLSYEQFLRQRLFGPLGMSRTRFNSDRLQPGDDVASGHSKQDFSKLVVAPRMTWSNVAGAGGIYSSVDDLARWVRVQLDGGVISGSGDDAKRLFSERAQREMWSMLTPIPVPKPAVPELAAATPNFMGYGEGWFLGDFQGRKLVWHTGGWPGMVSRITLVPQEKLGVIVLTNQEVGAAFNAVTLQVLEAYLAPQQRTDWLVAYAAAVAKSQGEADAAWQKHLTQRDAGAKPSLPASSYAGTYRDPWYGDVLITQEGDQLVMRFSHTAELVGTLEHWQHDSFIVHWRQRWLNADAFVNFALDVDGRVTGASMQAVSPLTDFSFDFQDLQLPRVRDEGADDQ